MDFLLEDLGAPNNRESQERPFSTFGRTKLSECRIFEEPHSYEDISA